MLPKEGVKSLRPYLYEKLTSYEKENIYPFHMPGHKRRIKNLIENPYAIDITEIDGFDNLNDPQDIIKQSMEETAKFYGTKKTFYLVNGSTVGILAAITATCKRGDKILMARNCHKAVYNAVRLLELDPIYLPLTYIPERNMFGGIDEEKLCEILKKEEGIKAVIITSPTYEGIVMHIERIKMWINPYKIPLIVDEAHGAHFPFYENFPESAIKKGADIVIQSLHKTMPAFTQTALLHICTDQISAEKVQDSISIYQSSSPSYLLMAGIEYAIHYGIENKNSFVEYEELLNCYRKKIQRLKNISLLEKEELKQYGAYDFDPCKLVIFFQNTKLTGNEISDILLKQYGLQMEMAERDYVIAISTICDSKEGFDRLYYALKDLDRKIEMENGEDSSNKQEKIHVMTDGQIKRYLPSKALEMKTKKCNLKEAKGAVCGSYIYIYPPGIPILVPGEQIKQSDIALIESYLESGFYVKGITREEIHDIMSVSEWEQAEPIHHERRMAIISSDYDIMSVSEREQAKPIHREQQIEKNNSNNEESSAVGQICYSITVIEENDRKRERNSV